MNPVYTNPPVDTNIRILVVDDEPQIRNTLVRALNLVGFHTEEADSGEEAIALLEMDPFDVLILDLLLPGMSGEEVMRRACHLQSDLMIIVLTGKASLESAIMAIKSQAFDYLLKPATMRDVIETVSSAVQRRREQQKDFARAVGEVLDKFQTSDSMPAAKMPILPSTRSILVTPPLKLQRTQRNVALLDKPDHKIDLTKGETEILACLMTHSDHPLSCRHIVREAWHYDIEKEEAESIIRPHISRLRQKIEDDPKNPQLIRTVRKRGYLFSSST